MQAIPTAPTRTPTQTGARISARFGAAMTPSVIQTMPGVGGKLTLGSDTQGSVPVVNLVSRYTPDSQASDLPFGGIEESGTSVFRMRGMVGGTSPPEPPGRIYAT